MEDVSTNYCRVTGRVIICHLSPRPWHTPIRTGVVLIAQSGMPGRSGCFCLVCVFDDAPLAFIVSISVVLRHTFPLRLPLVLI